MGLGHTTLAMPSVCAMKYIRKYFQTGELPASGTRCPVDMGGFDDVALRGRKGEEEEEVLLDALVQIARTWPYKWN